MSDHGRITESRATHLGREAWGLWLQNRLALQLLLERALPPAPDPPRHRIPIELDIVDVSDREGEPAVEIVEPWPDGAELQLWDGEEWHCVLQGTGKIPPYLPPAGGPVVHLGHWYFPGFAPADVRVFFLAVQGGAE